jgi:hypothetical protein
MRNKKLLRIVLLVVLIVVFAYISRRLSDNQDTTAASDSALTLVTEAPQTAAPAPAQTPAPDGGLTLVTAAPQTDAVPTEDGSYTDVEDVAYYLHTYGHLPDNYMTKAEAEDAGWNSYEGNLWDVAYGSSIGGDRFYNSEGQLPKGERYFEADVNYEGGYRGGERIVYTDDGDIWYTTDHYESFEKLY